MSTAPESCDCLITHSHEFIDMGPFDEAEHHVSVGVTGILKTVGLLTTENTGQFWNFKGERVPW